MDPIGQEVAGYRIEAPLATGGFSRVYVARGANGDEAIVKLGRERGGSRANTRARFAAPALAVVLGSVATRMRSVGPADVDLTLRCEAELLRSVPGGILPRLLAEGELARRPALVLERLRGPSLRELFEKGERVAPEVFLRILEALAGAARAGLPFHGDLKPDHVFLGDGPRFIDPAVRTENPRFYTVTPEYNPLLAAGPMSDVIAVAAMLYESATGELAFADAPPPFALELIPDAAEDRRLRTAFRQRVPKLEGRAGVPRGVARFVEQAFDELILDPAGGSLATAERAAERLREALRNAG